MSANPDAPAESRTVEVRIFLPELVAQWFEQRARANFKKRPTYIADLLIQLFRKENKL